MKNKKTNEFRLDEFKKEGLEIKTVTHLNMTNIGRPVHASLSQNEKFFAVITHDNKLLVWNIENRKKHNDDQEGGFDLIALVDLGKDHYIRIGWVHSTVVDGEENFEQDFIWMVIDNDPLEPYGEFTLFSMRDLRFCYRHPEVDLKGKMQHVIFDLPNDYVFYITDKGIYRSRALH